MPDDPTMMMAPSLQIASGPTQRDQDSVAPLMVSTSSARMDSVPSVSVVSAPLTNKPLIKKLVDIMVNEDGRHERTRAFVLAVCAGYAYADPAILRATLQRIGLETRCRAVPITVDAMYLRSTAYIIQSVDRRLVIVAYRGTEPTNIISWLADFETETEPVSEPPGGAVHSGFYRNMRAGRYAVVDVIDRALNGDYVDEHDEDSAQRRSRPADAETPVEAIYFTGHSFGGAMAILLALTLTDRLTGGASTPPVRTAEADTTFGRISRALRGVYTFGQPMVGTACLAEGLTDLPFRYRRYLQANDLVPHLPPRTSGDFAHFGREIRCDRRERGDDPDLLGQLASFGIRLEHRVPAPLGDLLRSLRTPARQTGLIGIATGVLTLAGGLFPVLNSRWLHWSIAEHAPHHYIRALAPEGLTNEFG